MSFTASPRRTLRPASSGRLQECARCAIERHLVAVDARHLSAEQIRLADEVGREDAARSEIEVGRRADLLDLRVVHETDAVRHDHRLLLVVRDVEDGNAELGAEPLDLQLHLVSELLVERAERFVHEHDRGAVDEAAGECDALLLTARERAW